MLPNSKILVCGHKGLVGSAIVRELTARGFTNIITSERTRVDLTSDSATESFFQRVEPEFVFLAAAKVGGIVANAAQSADFMVHNSRIQCNVMASARRTGVTKLLFFGSACAYPKFAPVPIKEEYLLTGELEPSNECYALAKISGFKLCQAYRKQHGCNFITCMPTNLYGPGDNYHPTDSHVIPGMIRKIHKQKMANEPVALLWGTGNPMREFLYSEDLARASILLMEKYDSPELINVGSGTGIKLSELADKIVRIIGFNGRLAWNSEKPDGTPVRSLDCSKLFGLGFSPQVTLEQGLEISYKDFLERHGCEYE